ncbi:peptidoglycan-binding protein [Streptomyces sp. C10]|uniref:peptidoglycan-binding protein n=1 Tax=Streptomyces sp. C10 TaxID=531941 RepID=UPI00397F308D
MAPRRTPGRRSAGRRGEAAVVVQQATGGCSAPAGGKTADGQWPRRGVRLAAGDLPAPGSPAGGRAPPDRPALGHHRVHHPPTPGRALGGTPRPAPGGVTATSPCAREEQAPRVAAIHQPTGHSCRRSLRFGRREWTDRCLFAAGQRQSGPGRPAHVLRATGASAARRPGPALRATGREPGGRPRRDPRHRRAAPGRQWPWRVRVAGTSAPDPERLRGGAIGGRYDADVRAAVARFQKWYGVRGDETGVYSDQTRRALMLRTK